MGFHGFPVVHISIIYLLYKSDCWLSLVAYMPFSLYPIKFPHFYIPKKIVKAVNKIAIYLFFSNKTWL